MKEHPFPNIPETTRSTDWLLTRTGSYSFTATPLTPAASWRVLRGLIQDTFEKFENLKPRVDPCEGGLEIHIRHMAPMRVTVQSARDVVSKALADAGAEVLRVPPTRMERLREAVTQAFVTDGQVDETFGLHDTPDGFEVRTPDVWVVVKQRSTPFEEWLENRGHYVWKDGVRMWQAITPDLMVPPTADEALRRSLFGLTGHTPDPQVVIDQFRDWLSQGATIRAGDPKGEDILKPLPDGTWHGGIVVDFSEVPKTVTAEPTDFSHTQTAADILKAAAETIENRAAERDTDSERSMGRCVAAFNALTGHPLSEADGWLFMSVLKHARSRSGSRATQDTFVDLAAYGALEGECVMRNGGTQ